MVKGDRPGTAFAKTTRPVIGSTVERNALFARLDDPPGCIGAWVSGPPGAGKTTLAASYVRARRLATLWYQVDADDEDPATFFHYFTHAARKLGKERERELPSFTKQHGDDVGSFARKFFRQLFSGGKEPLAIVIDNLHAVPTESGLLPVLEAGFAQVPKGSCLIVTSRSEPPPSFARLRATGQMTCITGKDLCLSPEDIVLMGRLRGQVVSPESATMLHERTQGWAAGLTLMLEHARFSGRIVEVPGHTTPQVIFDYLAGEIFDRFEPRIRAFLLRIGCLPRATAAMAAALAGEPGAERMLDNLARNDYFVRDVSSDAGRLYRLHPLLREFLRRRAAQALPEAASAAWLARAAALLREAGYTEDAVALLVEAGDWKEVATIAVEESNALLAQGRSDTLAAWLDLLPPGVVETSPRLLRASAAARAHASPRAARRMYERAFERFREQRDAAGMLESCAGIVEASIFEFDDITALDRWLGTLEDLLAQDRGTASSPLDGATATLIGATLLRDPGNARVEGWLAASSNGDGVAHLRVLAALARGDFAAANAALGDRSGASATAAAGVVEALVLLIAGRSEDATRVVEEALSTADADGLHADDPWLLSIAAAAGLGAGDRARARDALERLERMGPRLRRGDRACVHYLHGWTAALDGDLAGAHSELKTALAVAVESGIPWFECLARAGLAQVQIDGGDRRGADAQLRTAVALSERLRSQWLSYAVELAAAHAARRAGDERATLDLLRAAFRRGHEYGFRQPLGGRPPALAELCAIALRDDVESEFARALVRDGKLTPAAPPLRVSGWPWPFRIVTLGGFQCLRADSAVELSAKGPGRPMELLKVLVALGRHNVRADQLADALWPSAEADFAYKSFTATLHRLRRALDDDDALILRDGRLTLNKALVWVDTWALEQLFDDFDAAVRGVDACTDEALRRRSIEEALALYRGPFLPDESEQPSYLACREHLRVRLLRILTRIARGSEESGVTEAAVDTWLRFIEVDELCEPLHRQLMLCLQRSGRTTEAAAAYERLRTIFSARLKAMPSVETQALYAALRAGGASVAPS